MADNKKLILNLFAGMQDALFLGDRFANGEFVSFLQPGQFLSTNLKENANSDDMAIQSDIANILIDSSYVNKYNDITYSSSKELLGSVNQVYYDLLNHAALPFKALDPATLKEIADIQAWIGSNTSNYELYRERYFDAVEAYETEAHKQDPSPGKLQRLAQKKLDASKNWETFGQKNIYDRKYGRLVYLTEEDPSSYWGKLQQRLDTQKQQAPRKGEYYQTFLVPSISSWSSASWATFERNISEKDAYEYSKSTSWSGGISGRWGLWSWGGGTSGSTNFEHKESDISTVSLKFDYLRVRIFRPWLVEDVFGYKFWTWKTDFGGQLLSDGGNLAIDPPVRPIGRMPVLPRYLIVIRNLEISAAFSKDVSDWYHSEVSHNASIGWGPFSISGSYSESTTSQYVHASFDGVTFRIEQPQIIARTGLLLPRSPDPNLALSWQDDAWFPPKTLLEIDKLRSQDYLYSLAEELAMEGVAEAERVANLWRSQKQKEIDQVIAEAEAAEAKRLGMRGG